MIRRLKLQSSGDNMTRHKPTKPIIVIKKLTEHIKAQIKTLWPVTRVVQQQTTNPLFCALSSSANKSVLNKQYQPLVFFSRTSPLALVYFDGALTAIGPMRLPQDKPICGPKSAYSGAKVNPQ